MRAGRRRITIISGKKIALCGHMRSGKDEVAKYLEERYGFTRFAFGDGIREMCGRLYPEQMVDGKKPRALFQGFGQMARHFDSNVWIKYMANDIDFYCRDYDNIVVSDLRQPNEYEWLKINGYSIVRVNSSTGVRILRMVGNGDSYDPKDLEHETESHIAGFDVDYEIYNDSTINELHAQIDATMAQI